MSLYAQDISELVQKLNEEKALYHKTKVESAGILTLYKRSDLDRMQAHKLKDILKSLKFFTLSEGRTGDTYLLSDGSKTPFSPMFRLYIDDHEVTSAIYGSAILHFANMDIGFVDHIEIYMGGNAISFGDEAGIITIRLYSKHPNRERGTSISVRSDDKKSFDTSMCLTKTFENNSFLISSLTLNNTKRDYVYNNNSYYSKNQNSNEIYLKYDYKDMGYVSIGHFEKEQDAFAGVGMRATPYNPNEKSRNYDFINFYFNLPYSFTLISSIDKATNVQKFSDSNQIYITQNTSPFYEFNGKFNETIYKLKLKHKKEHKNGTFKSGIEFIQKNYDIDYMKMDDKITNTITGPSKLNIFSIYSEESYNINKNNLLIGTVKLDNYSDNYNKKNSWEMMARVGYIHLFNENLTIKNFISKNYLYPSFSYTSTFPNNIFSNPNLEPEYFTSITSVLKYKKKKNNIKIGLSYIKQSDEIVVDTISRKFINSNQNIRSFKTFLDFTHNFNYENKVQFEIYKTKFINNNITAYSPTLGASLKFYNSFGKFDIYNELIYRQGYTYKSPVAFLSDINIENGFDYTASIKYKYNHALTLSLKGENIFNKASKTPLLGIGAVPSEQKRVLFQMEYFF